MKVDAGDFVPRAAEVSFAYMRTMRLTARVPSGLYKATVLFSSYGEAHLIGSMWAVIASYSFTIKSRRELKPRTADIGTRVRSIELWSTR